MYIRIGNGLLRPRYESDCVTITRKISDAIYLRPDIAMTTAINLKKQWGITAEAIPEYEAERLCEQQ